MQALDEEQWLQVARTLETRPPMPWFNVRRMSEADLRAVYRYVRHLGPAGTVAPAYLPPDRTPPQPYVQFPAPPQ
jgi:mono/diheme cytochrome c family protein